MSDIPATISPKKWVRARVRTAPFQWEEVWGLEKPDGTFYCPADGLTYEKWHRVDKDPPQKRFVASAE